MDFVIGFLISINFKGNSYNVIPVILNCFTKMVHYKYVNNIINMAGLREIIIDVDVRYHGLSQVNYQ